MKNIWMELIYWKRQVWAALKSKALMSGVLGGNLDFAGSKREMLWPAENM